MHKKLISCVVASALAFSSMGVAEDQIIAPETEQTEYQEPAENQEANNEQLTPPPADTPVASQPREVGPASDAPARAARKRKWQNIGIACLAVVAASLGIYFASTNGGHCAK